MSHEKYHAGSLEEKVILSLYLSAPFKHRRAASQRHDELFGDPICHGDGFPESGPVLLSFLTLCKRWLQKNLKSRSPWPVPNCRVNGQEYRWGSRHTGCPLLTLRVSLSGSPATTEEGACQRFLTALLLIRLDSHWPGCCCVWFGLADRGKFLNRLGLCN